MTDRFCRVCHTVRLSVANVTGRCDECAEHHDVGLVPVVDLPPGMSLCGRCKRAAVKHRGGRCRECNKLYMRQWQARRRQAVYP